MSTSTTWRDAYTAVADRIVAAAPTATPALTSASACVDLIFPVDVPRLAALVHAAQTDRNSADHTPGPALIRRILDRVAAGRGGELLCPWPDGPAWFTRLLGEPQRRQLGGTGPQASWALAVLGAPSVLALADRSADQLAVIDPRTGLCLGDEVVAAGSVIASGEPRKRPHCVLEFTAGTPIGNDLVRRSTRLILRFGDEPLECDDDFAALTPTLTHARAGLLSGMNALPADDIDGPVWLGRLARSWSEAGMPTVHHELAEFPTPERMRAALRATVATSIGLSLSEVYVLAGRSGDPRLLARDAAQRGGATRAVVHGDAWALAVHRDDPAHQRDVLMIGSAVAAARAHHGAPSTELTPATEATFTDDLPSSGDLGDGWTATAVASPFLARPTATIGLGDTFVAGLLLAEGLS